MCIRDSNEMMVKRKAAQESERIDRIENPHKYRTSKLARRNARMLMAVAAGMGVNSF